MESNGIKTENAKDKRPIRLLSPCFGGNKLYYNWDDNNALAIGTEIRDAIRSAMNFVVELAKPLDNCRIDDLDLRDYDQVRSLAKKFNKAVHQTKKEHPNIVAANNNEALNKELLRHIITTSYNRAVDNEKSLNKHYEAFSSQTYGETSYERMQKIIEEVQPTENDVFVDLGSGVGQLVVHVAGATNVLKAVGIEIAQLPAKFAQRLEAEFKKSMDWFGRHHQNFNLEFGDFLDRKYRDLILHEATIIFINNYAFQSDLETRIKREFISELRNGTRVISTKPYVPLNKIGITDRQLSDISSIIDIVEMKPVANPCSWTSAYVPYYLHTVNRAKLEKYFYDLKNPVRASSSSGGSRRSSTPSSKASKSNSRESSVGVKDSSNCNLRGVNTGNNEEICFGPTTRRKWTEYVTELEQQKRRKSGVRISNDAKIECAELEETSSTLIFTSDQKTHLPEQSSTQTQPPITTLCDKHQMSPDSLPHASPSTNIAPTTFQFDPPKVVDESARATSPPRKKRKYVRREKKAPAIRGRPRKYDKGIERDMQQTRKRPKISDDARDGMEILHQMTCAVASGNDFDPLSFLADLSSQRESKNLPNPNSKADPNSIPFPIVPVSRQNTPQDGKYPSLDKFLGDLRVLYENFLDSVVNNNSSQLLRKSSDVATEITPKKNHAQLMRQFSSLSADENSNNAKIGMEIKGVKKDHPVAHHLGSSSQQSTVFLDRLTATFERYQQLQNRFVEIQHELGDTNIELQLLLREYQQQTGESEIERLQKQLVQLQNERQLVAVQQMNALTSPHPPNSSTAASILQNSQLTQAGVDLLVNELAHQLINNTRLNAPPLLTQLGIFNSPHQQELAALQALASVASIPMSPVIGHHQSPSAIPTSTLQQNTLQNQAPLQQQAPPPLQTPLVQNFLNSLDLCQLSGVSNSNSGIASNKTRNVAINASITAPNPTELTANTTNIGPNNVATSSTFQVDTQQRLSQQLILELQPTASPINGSTADSTIAAVVDEVASAGSTLKRTASRPRNSRCASAKRTSSQSKTQPDDPQKNEEIERQEIVAKALEVDSAAKSAEKERKARSAEKRKLIYQTDSFVPTSSNTTSLQNSTEINSPIGIITEANTVSSPIHLFSFPQINRQNQVPSTTSIFQQHAQQQSHCVQTLTNSITKNTTVLPTKSLNNQCTISTSYNNLNISSPISTPVKDSIPLIKMNLPPPPIGTVPPSSLVAIKVENLTPPK